MLALLVASRPLGWLLAGWGLIGRPVAMHVALSLDWFCLLVWLGALSICTSFWFATIAWLTGGKPKNHPRPSRIGIINSMCVTLCN